MDPAHLREAETNFVLKSRLFAKRFCPRAGESQNRILQMRKVGTCRVERGLADWRYFECRLSMWDVLEMLLLVDSLTVMCAANLAPERYCNCNKCNTAWAGRRRLHRMESPLSSPPLPLQDLFWCFRVFLVAMIAVS
jgi:hypothetical protein